MKKPSDRQPYVPISWEEFRDTGLLWYINTQLHAFGMTIALKQDKETKEIISAAPCKTIFQGFNQETNRRGYKNIKKYMKSLE